MWAVISTRYNDTLVRLKSSLMYHYVYNVDVLTQIAFVLGLVADEGDASGWKIISAINVLTQLYLFSRCSSIWADDIFENFAYSLVYVVILTRTEIVCVTLCRECVFLLIF